MESVLLRELSKTEPGQSPGGLAGEFLNHPDLVPLLPFSSIDSSCNSELLKQKFDWSLLPVFSLSTILYILCPGHLEN